LGRLRKLSETVPAVSERSGFGSRAQSTARGDMVK